MALTAAGLAQAALAAGALAAGVGLYVATRPVAEPPARVAAPEAPAGPAPVAETAPEPPEPTSPTAPSLDLVRVAPDGAAVVAGRATPGAVVTLRADGEPLAEVEADASGEFVAILDVEPAAAPRALTLESRDRAGETAASADLVVLLPAAPGEAAAAPAPPAPPQPRAGAEGFAPAAGVAAPAPTVAATALVREGSVEATPSEAGPRGLTLASVAYGETGAVTLAGIGSAGSRIRAYVNDSFARDATVDEGGRWTLELDDLKAGVHRLRIDALRADGTVEARLETPFERATPPAPGSDATGAATVTVQPGANLWTIARLHYGSGVLYTQIHTANRDLIRDPALIYPGQIFVLPEAAAAE